MLRAGLGRADITVFEPGMLTLGWGDPRGGLDGVDVPLEARALVVHCPRTRRRIAIVCADLCFISGLLRTEVMARLAERPELEVDDGSLLLTATHTHSGPGGFSHHVLYSLSAPGVSARVVETLAEGIVLSIAAAAARLRPAQLRYVEQSLGPDLPFVRRRSTVRNASMAHQMRVLRVDDEAGVPLGLVSFFALHATCLHGESRRVHPDHKGLSAAMLEHELGTHSPADHPFVAICAQEAAGDITPNRVLDRTRNVFAGHQPDHGHVQWVAREQALAIASAYRAARDVPALDDTIDARLRVATFSERTFTTTDGRKVTTTRPLLGLSMALGTDEGRGPLAPLGRGCRVLARLHAALRPSDAKVPFVDLERALDGRIFGLVPARLLLRGPGPQLAALRRLIAEGQSPGPWAPVALPVQLLQIGRLRIAAISGEPTSSAAQQLRQVLEHRGSCDRVVILGYSNDYASYITTPEEYRAQNYEGGCTLYGPETLSLWCAELDALSAAMDAGTDPEPARRPIAPSLAELGVQAFVAYPRPQGSGGLPRNTRQSGAPWERVHESARYDTIVIGAGFAGLCAATRLQRAGQRVLLLEASERVGGRARSTPDGADLGCGFLGAEHTFALSLVAELGLTCIDYCKDAPANPSFRSMTPEGLQDMRLDQAWFGIQGCKKDGPLVDRLGLLRGMLQWILLENLINHRAPGTGPFARRLDRITVGQWMDRLPMRPRHLDLIRLAVTAIWSTDPDRMSLLYLLWYTANNGGVLTICNDQAGGPQQFGVRGGLGGMAQTMADRFQGELRMQTPVTGVARGKSGFLVTLGDGRTEMASDVIVSATPSAVARHIAFEPPLPESTRRFLDQPMGHAIKGVLEYETRWWRKYPNGDQYQFYAGRAGGVLEWMLDTSEPDRGVYRFVVFLRAPARDLDPNALLDRVKSELFELTQDERCLEVSRFECFDWSRTPYVGGGPVTFCTPGALTSGPDREFSGNIHFAGAEYSDQFTGYVEGAIRSGTRAASRVLNLRPDPALSAAGVRWAHLAVAAAAYAPVALAVEILQWLHRPGSVVSGLPTTS